MSAPITNLSMYAGEDRDFQDTITQFDGTPKNVSGFSITFVVHAYGNPSVIYLTKTTNPGGGITIIDGPNGVVQIMVVALDTVGMLPGEYQYYVETTDLGADSVMSEGLFTILQR